MMSPYPHYRRCLALFLLLSILIGMLPVQAKATEADLPVSGINSGEVKPATKIAVPSTSDLLSQINSLLIPSVTHVKAPWDNLNGLYFLVCANRTIDHRSRGATYGYLALNNSATANSIAQKNGLKTLPISISNNRVKIDSAEADLTHAVNIYRNTYEIDDTLKKTLNNTLRDNLANTISYGSYKGKVIGSLMNVYEPAKVDCDLNKYTYNIKFSNGKFLNFNVYETNSAGNGTYPMLITPSTSDNYFKLYKTNYNGTTDSDGAVVPYSYWVGVDTYAPSTAFEYNPYTLTAATPNQIRRNNYGDRNVSGWPWNKNTFNTNWYLYRITAHTLELYNTLKGSTVTNFLRAGNASGAYSTEAYNGYLTTVQQCIDYYNDNYTKTSTDDAFVKQCRAFCTILTSSITMLNKEAADRAALNNMSTNSSKYLDLPMTVLDFRADGLLFESKNNVTAYTLSTRGSADETTLKNELGLPHPGKDDGSGARVGLMLDEMVKGYPVYTKETVAYIARALIKKHQFNDAPDTKFDPSWNNIFLSRANQWTAANEGSWEDTLSKVGGKNGGVMSYSQVQTAFDLAYYMLNHLWRPVEEKDVLSGTQESNPVYYNKVAKELHTLRLTKNSDGINYSFQSNLDVGRDLNKGIVFNTGNADDGTAPQLNILTDLGFEHPSLYGNDQTGIKADHDGSSTTAYAARANYNYGLHVKSVFVYYDAKDLQFTFSGDDDVYFFVNGVLVCDIGGMHSAVTKTCKINNFAFQLDLHDGDICTFDMFFIDRHTSGINLNFTTNIDMMAAAAVTKEEQYIYTGTEMAVETIREGSVVEDGTEIGYSYMLLNRSDLGVNHVSFHDEKLGVKLNKDQILLNGKANAEDLILTYRSYDPESHQYASVAPVVYTYEKTEGVAFEDTEFYRMLSQAVHSKATNIPLANQIYQISGLGEAELRALLELGIPANVQMEIYGTHQTATTSLGGSISDVQTHCYSLDQYDVQTVALSGYDKRSVQVIEEPSFTVDAPLELILDYGKAVEIPMEELTRSITTSGGAVATFLGFMEGGDHGTVMTAKPSNIKCSQYGDSYRTPNGVYENRGDHFRFTLSRFLEERDRVNAVYSVSAAIGPSGATAWWYTIVEIQISPATNVYYEAEDFVGTEFTYEEKSANGVVTEYESRYQDDRKKLTEGQLNRYMRSPDPTHDISMLFFGFGKTETDGLRYDKNPNYNHTYFDANTNWRGSSGHTLNIANGALHFTASPVNSDTWVHFSTGASGSEFTSLSYKPDPEDWFEVRLKINDLSALANRSVIKFDIELYRNSTDLYKIAHSKIVETEGEIDTQKYYTVSFPMPTNSGGWANTSTRTYLPYDELGTIKRLVFIPTGLNNPSTLNCSVDYIYLGPKSKMPSAQGGHLLFDFEQSSAAEYRYQSECYLGTNYDLQGNWHYNPDRNTAPTLEDGSLKLVTNAANTTNYINWARTGTSPKNNGLRYIPSVRDYCQVRFKILGGQEVHSDSAFVGLYFSNDGVDAPNENHTHYNYDFEKTASGDWYTVTFPIDCDLWYASQIITSVQIHFGGVKSTEDGLLTYYIDYFYIGPSQAQDTGYVKTTNDYYGRDDVLYFGFNDNTDSNRHYDQAMYFHTNYDNAARWYSNPNKSSVEIQDGSMRMLIKAPYNNNNDANCNPFAQTVEVSNPLVPALNYIPTGRDFVQVRFRFSNCTTINSSEGPWVMMYFMTNRTPDPGHGVLPNDYFRVKADPSIVSCGEWVTVTQSANNTFRNADTIDAVRLCFNNLRSTNSEVGIVEVDYIYVGPEEFLPDRDIYGYDHSYTDDRGLSDGESLYIYGKGVNVNNATSYSHANFSFKGTGFDIISRSGSTQGSIRVDVKDPQGTLVKSVTVNNKGELKLYQIPVVSVHDLPYGEYSVSIGVNKPVEVSIPALSRGGEFYLDAVRIYDPIHCEDPTEGSGEEKLLSAYTKDTEAYPYFKEVRDTLLSADKFHSLTGSTEGGVYIDQREVAPDEDEGISVENNITKLISTYEKIGPKNEVYLSKGQSVSFKLCLNTVETPVSIDIAAKAVNMSDSPVLKVAHTTSQSSSPVNTQSWDILSNTAVYYALSIQESDFARDADGRYLYLVISNTGEDSVLSITDLKFAYESEPTFLDDSEAPVKKSAEDLSPIRFLVDEKLTHAIAKVYQHQTEVPKDQGVIIDGQISLMHSLNLASDISLNYVIGAEHLEAYDRFYLNCVLYDQTMVRLEPVLRGDYYYFTLDGLTAVTINDVVEATLTMWSGEQCYTSPTDRYSVAQYAYTQLGKENSSTELKRLCADLLRYGALAQSYKAYRIHALADSRLTESQKAYLTDLEKVSFVKTDRIGNEFTEPVAVWRGKALDLTSKVGLTLVFSVTDPEISAEALRLKVSYTDMDGKALTAWIGGARLYHEEMGYYAFSFHELPVSELRTVAEMQIYLADTPLSCTLTYSAESYGSNKTGTLGQLCKALFAYSDSAAAFFR